MTCFASPRTGSQGSNDPVSRYGGSVLTVIKRFPNCIEIGLTALYFAAALLVAIFNTGCVPATYFSPSGTTGQAACTYVYGNPSKYQIDFVNLTVFINSEIKDEHTIALFMSFSLPRTQSVKLLSKKVDVFVNRKIVGSYNIDKITTFDLSSTPSTAHDVSDKYLLSGSESNFYLLETRINIPSDEFSVHMPRLVTYGNVLDTGLITLSKKSEWTSIFCNSPKRVRGNYYDSLP